MNGFGFIEYKDAMDARDVVPGELRRCPIISVIFFPLQNRYANRSPPPVAFRTFQNPLGLPRSTL
jgi:hypothetical protein